MKIGSLWKWSTEGSRLIREHCYGKEKWGIEARVQCTLEFKTQLEFGFCKCESLGKVVQEVSEQKILKVKPF